jgi:uncharacterized membrane protein
VEGIFMLIMVVLFLVAVAAIVAAITSRNRALDAASIATKKRWSAGEKTHWSDYVGDFERLKRR